MWEWAEITLFSFLIGSLALLDNNEPRHATFGDVNKNVKNVVNIMGPTICSVCGADGGLLKEAIVVTSYYGRWNRVMFSARSRSKHGHASIRVAGDGGSGEFWRQRFGCWPISSPWIGSRSCLQEVADFTKTKMFPCLKRAFSSGL